MQSGDDACSRSSDGISWWILPLQQLTLELPGLVIQLLTIHSCRPRGHLRPIPNILPSKMLMLTLTITYALSLHFLILCAMMAIIWCLYLRASCGACARVSFLTSVYLLTKYIIHTSIVKGAYLCRITWTFSFGSCCLMLNNSLAHID